MSTLNPEKRLAHLPGASEMSQGDDLEVMIASLDERWQEVKRLLRAQEAALLEEMPDSPVSLAELSPAEQLRQEEDGTKKSWWNSLLPSDKAKFGVTAQEADAIIQRVEKLDEDVKIREQLAYIEKQNFTLTVYSIVCTVLILFMVFFTYFFQVSYASNRNSVDQAAPLQAADTKGGSNPVAASAAAVQTAPEAPPGKPADEKLPTVTSTPQGAATPQVEYVGARNSNKYHFRSCKWVKYIYPKNERVFHSVAEAKKAGYIRCPTCRPPLTDEPQTAAR